MRRVLPLTVVFFVVGAWGAAAQAPSAPGSLVRLSAESPVMEGTAGPSTRDVNALLALQVRSGEGSWALRGAVIGAVAGSVATYLVTHHGGSTSLCDRSANQDAMGQRECVAVTVLGGAAGAGLGAWIGSKFRR